MSDQSPAAATSESEARRVIEAEVVRESPQSKAKDEGLPPVLAGMLFDLLDFLTAGPIGVATGIFVGGLGAFLIGGLYKLPVKTRLLLAAGAAAYCSMPGTAPVPLGTLIGAWLGAKR